MVDATIQQEIYAHLNRLSVEEQRKVAEFARTLAAPQIPGVPGTALLKFAGIIDEAELDSMSKAIEDGCERVDTSEW